MVEEVVLDKNENKDEEETSKMFSCLKERPLWFLFLVMTINGLFSLACSALIIKIEKPAQDKRYTLIFSLFTINLTKRFSNNFSWDFEGIFDTISVY